MNDENISIDASPKNSELSPLGTDSPPSSFLQHMNIPQFLAGSAGSAISRLLGSAVDIPAAHLEAISRGVRDRADAKTIVNRAIANAVANSAASDPDLIARAANSLIAKEFRHQTNKENIAYKAIEILREESVQQSQEPQSDASPLPDVDEDWLNVFERYAEDASSDRMQTLWARVLAGQIRKPKRFSLSTLRFISELDMDTATLFQQYIPFILNNDFIIDDRQAEGRPFMDKFDLQDAGLLKGAGSHMAKSIKFNSPDHKLHPIIAALIFIQGRHIVVTANAGHILIIPCVAITKIASELLEIVKLPFNQAAFDDVIAKIPKEGLINITLAGDPSQVLWQAPQPPATPAKEPPQ